MSPFIKEQSDALVKLGIDVDYFPVEGKGIFGYLKNYPKLRTYITKNKPDIVHAHYGLSGLLANLQRIVPVITTFHGSDVNNIKAFRFSKYAYKLSKAAVFVEKSMMETLGPSNKNHLIPCGVDLTIFNPTTSQSADNKSEDFAQIKKRILFSSAFHNHVKNYPLAKNACDALNINSDAAVQLIELKNFARYEVSALLNEVDAALHTSFSEGSPQFIKEAMACNCPVVSTDVGDVRWLFGDLEGYYITSFDPHDVAEKIKMALDFADKHGRTRGRERIIELGLDAESIAKRIIKVYESVLEDRDKRHGA